MRMETAQSVWVKGEFWTRDSLDFCMILLPCFVYLMKCCRHVYVGLCYFIYLSYCVFNSGQRMLFYINFWPKIYSTPPKLNLKWCGDSPFGADYPSPPHRRGGIAIMSGVCVIMCVRRGGTRRFWIRDFLGPRFSIFSKLVLEIIYWPVWVDALGVYHGPYPFSKKVLYGIGFRLFDVF